MFLAQDKDNQSFLRLFIEWWATVFNRRNFFTGFQFVLKFNLQEFFPNCYQVHSDTPI